MNGPSSASDDDPLGVIVDSFLARYRRGERPALTDLIALHPDLAAEIHELIPALVKLEQFGGSADGAVDSPNGSARWSECGDEGPCPERLGDYLIIRRIGGGGMGVVYEAEHESLKSRVALKVVHPRYRADAKYLRRFHAEARVAAGLHHTNIVSVFDYGDHDGVWYYAMQFIQGQPLDRVLADIRRLRDEETGDGVKGDPDAVLTVLPPSLPTPRSTAVMHGLLTGRFATATPTDEPVDATEPIEACAFNFPQQAGDVADGRAPADPRAAEPSTLGSSLLGDLSELRYYREIARVGAQVADAMEYAHRRGVLHRDIKPSNLLLDALGNVWVTDFGLAKLEEGHDLSHSRELVGTLRYMAPERFRGISNRRGDIYSLGATLYELLTLRAPFEASDQLRMIELIRHESPAPPRHVGRNIPRDFETIVLKALAKDPHDRFGSAGEMANELRRFIDGRTIRSRPVSMAEHVWRWCKRDPWLAGANITAVVLITVLAIVSTAAAIVYRNQAELLLKQADALGRQATALVDERGRSDTASLNARWRAVDAYTAQARAGKFSRRQGQRFDSLEAVSQATKLLDGLPPGPEVVSRRGTLRDLAIACLALPDLKPTGRVITRSRGAFASAFDPRMSRYALWFRDGAISIRRFADDHEIARFSFPGAQGVGVFAFSPDGRYLATTHSPTYALKVWDVDQGKIAADDVGPVYGGAAKFSPDSRKIGVAHNGDSLIVYDLATGRPGRRFAAGVSDLAFRPDGTQIAVFDRSANPLTCEILDGETLTRVGAFALRVSANSISWSPDGSTLAFVGDDLKIDLFDAATGIRRASLEGHFNAGIRVAYHPAGTLLASGDWSSQLRLWDAARGRPLLNLTSFCVPEISDDGRIVISFEDQLTVCQLEPALEYRTFTRASAELRGFADSSVRHDGRLLAVGATDGAILWDLARGTELAYLPIGNAWHLMFDSSGDLITSGTLGVRRWAIDFDAGRGELKIGPPRPLPLPAGNCGIAVDRSGRITAKADHSYVYVATPERTGRIGPLNDCRYVTISPDGQWLATGTQGAGHGPVVWRVCDLTKVAGLSVDDGTGVAFSPDGRLLATMTAPCRLWDVGTWREVRRIGDGGGCFSPDGRLMVVQEASKVIRLVETETGRTLARLESPDLSVFTPSFSPDGSRLVMTTPDGPSVHVWDLRAIRRRLAGMGLDWDAPAYSDHDPAAPSAPPIRRVEIRDFEHAIVRGATLASEGHWDEGAVAYEQAFHYGTSDEPYQWFERAILNMAVGDRAACRAACQRMLDVYNDNSQPQWLLFTANALALAPEGPAEETAALRLAEHGPPRFPTYFPST